MNAAPMALLLMVLWGCASTPEEDTAPEVIDYSEPGIFAPGTLEDSVVGQTGVALNLQIWYPSVETGGEPIRYDSLWEGASYDGLEAACELPRPVVVFSHGYGGVRWQSAFLTEHLATHGYVVIAPDHTHNTYLDSSSTEFASVTTRRPLDVADSFDWLSLQSTAPDSPLYGCIDPAAGYAVSGHSFGGYTAFAVSGAQVHDPTSDAMLDLSDDRAWAALALAPWNVEGALTPETMETVSSPVMTLSGTRDENTTWAQVTALFEGLLR